MGYFLRASPHMAVYVVFPWPWSFTVVQWEPSPLWFRIHKSLLWEQWQVQNQKLHCQLQALKMLKKWDGPQFCKHCGHMWGSGLNGWTEWNREIMEWIQWVDGQNSDWSATWMSYALLCSYYLCTSLSPFSGLMWVMVEAIEAVATSASHRDRSSIVTKMDGVMVYLWYVHDIFMTYMTCMCIW